MNLVKGLQQKGERDAEKLRNEMVALIKKSLSPA